MHVFEAGDAEQWLAKLEAHQGDICLHFQAHNSMGSGSCSQYAHRGLICRLFAYSARTNKYGERELVSCQVIKTEQSENYKRATRMITDGESVPVMNQYYMRLAGIDPQLAQEFYPINKAIKRAIETVLHYYAYREATE